MNSLLLLQPPNHNSKPSMTTATTRWFKVIQLSFTITALSNFNRAYTDLSVETLMRNTSDYFITKSTLIKVWSRGTTLDAEAMCVWHHLQDHRHKSYKCILRAQKLTFPSNSHSQISFQFSSATFLWHCLPKWPEDKCNSHGQCSHQWMLFMYIC